MITMLIGAMRIGSRSAILAIGLGAMMFSGGGCAARGGSDRSALQEASREGEDGGATKPTGRDVEIHETGDGLRGKIYADEAVFVGESAIRGEHLFEWAEAVALARRADPSGEFILAGLRIYIDHGTLGEIALTERFVQDVKAKDGPRWNEPTPEGLIREARARALSKERYSEFAERAGHWTIDETLAGLEAAEEATRLRSLVLLRGGRDPAPYLDRVLAHLHAASAAERRATIDVIAAYVSEDPRVIDALLAALKDSDAYVRHDAASAIERSSTIPRRVVEPLAAAMKGADTGVRRSIIAVLASYGREIPEAAAALADGVHDPDIVVREISVEARSRPDVQGAASNSSLIAALRDANPSVRRDAAFALRQRKADSEEVMAALTAAVDQGNYIVREALADAMDRAQKERTSALPVLKETAEKGENPSARAYARAALKEIEGEKRRVPLRGDH